jgi:shikimate kinase
MEISAIQNLNKPIVLVGMMGVGKTTYGRKLAIALQTNFTDIDQAIENDIGHSVSWIFENAGEDRFRKLEENKIKELIGDKKLKVVALGGGAFLSQTNRDFIKQNAISIWLSCPPELINARISQRKDRPLLQGDGDKLQKIKDILQMREKFYAESDLKIETEKFLQKEVPAKIIEKIEKFITENILS